MRESSRLLLGVGATLLTGWALGYWSAPRRDALALASRETRTASPVASREFSAASRSHAARIAAGAAHSEEKTVDLADALRSAAAQRGYFQRRRETWQVALQLDEAGLADALALTNAMPLGERTWVQPTLIARWLELNPDAAVTWVRALPAGTPRAELLAETFQTLGMQDPQAALHLLAGTSPAERGDSQTLLRKIFDGWGHHDPAAAAAAALTLEGRERSVALHASLWQWARVDPRAALAWQDRATTPAEQRSNFDTILRFWTESDPQAAEAHVQSLSGELRTAGLQTLIRHLATSDAAAAERLLEQVPAGRARSAQVRSLIDAVDEQNPQFAARLILSLPPKDQEHGTHSVARAFARTDRAGALEWAGQLALPAARDRALGEIMAEWAGQDPRAAVEYCAAHLPGKDRALDRAIDTWAGKTPEAALAWVNARAPGTEREKLLASVAGIVAQQDRAAALRILESLPAGSDARRSAVVSIGSTWARTDAAGALHWIAQLSGPAGDAALNNILHTTVREDPVATAVWLDKLPVGDRRNQAVRTFSSAIVRDDPEGAMAWAATISDPQQRDNCVSNLLSNWKNDDQEAARAWARTSLLLSEAQRDRFLERTANGR